MNFSRAELFLPVGKTKTGRDRRIPISTVLRAVLQRRRLDPAGEALPSEAYVFRDEVGRQRQNCMTAWLATCRRANITDLHFHDLRREAGSRWMDAGIPLATIQRWLGHSNIAQTSTYLGASLGADEQDMRVSEERMGRVTPLPNVAVSAGSIGSEPIPSDTEATRKDSIKRGRALTGMGLGMLWEQDVGGSNPSAPTNSLTWLRLAVVDSARTALL